MNKISAGQQVSIIIAVFFVSRIIAGMLGLHMNMWALSAYWQYLDIETLRYHLLAGVWYDHAQPPVFNLFLGIVLKLSGVHYPFLFALMLKIISLVNALLLFSIVRKITTVGFLPLLVAIAYLLSPATLIFECELFYTSSISLLLLISVFYLIRYTTSGSWWTSVGIVLPLALLCLTRSVYHILWLIVILTILIIYFKKRQAQTDPALKGEKQNLHSPFLVSRKRGLNNLILASIAGLILVGSWYVKNEIIFGRFTTSTWLGMNMARNVFHDNDVKDSNRIEAYEPFSRIGVYRKFLDPSFENKYQGLNDRDLLNEMKNDSLINETEVSYIPVSDLYQKASIHYIKTHKGAYVKNVFQSFILYFTPATIYSLAVEQSAKIKPYDLIYSFNLTHFANSKQKRRIALTISALPKLFLYLFVFFYMIRFCVQSRSLTPWNLFIMLTIAYVFGLSSLFEHYENMRFRFETEPLFLILAAQVFSRLYSRFQIRQTPRVDGMLA